MYTAEQVLKKLSPLSPPNSNAEIIINKISAEEILAPNLAKNEAKSAQVLADAIESARLPDGIVSKGTVIVRKGDIVTPDVANTLGQCYKIMVETNEKESSHAWSWFA